MRQPNRMLLAATCAAGVAWLAVPALARAAAPDTSAAVATLDGLVAAERAFSAASVERGMKDAFIEYLAEDGVIFAPGPLNGRKRWAERPNPKATLIWAPEYAEVAAAGDIGVSLGPWEYRPHGAAPADVAHGHFISVWRRGDDSPWRVAVDLGISHGKLERGLSEVVFEAGPLHVAKKSKERGAGMVVGGAVVGRRLGFGVGFGNYIVSPSDRAFRSAAHEKHRMMSEERNYAYTSKRKGGEDALHAVAADGVWLFRDGAAPARGLVEGAERLAAQPARVEWLPSGNGVSGSLDLGYSYGLARRWAPAASRPDTSSYLHVWRREPAGAWRLIVDVEVPFPKR